MTLPSLMPLAGAALVPVLEKVIDGVADSLSFLDVLHRQDQADATEAVRDAESNQLQQDTAQLVDRLRQRFAQLGIDLTTPLRLKQDGRDGVVVDGDHPDRVVVESIFGNDDELTSLFNAVATLASRGRDRANSDITQEFRFVVSQTDSLIEFA